MSVTSNFRPGDCLRWHRVSSGETTVAAGAQNIPGTLHQMRWQGTDTECGNRDFAYLARPRIDALKECCGGAFSEGFAARRIGGDLEWGWPAARSIELV
jgi:hypothetical protein